MVSLRRTRYSIRRVCRRSRCHLVMHTLPSPIGSPRREGFEVTPTRPSSPLPCPLVSTLRPGSVAVSAAPHDRPFLTFERHFSLDRTPSTFATAYRRPRTDRFALRSHNAYLCASKRCPFIPPHRIANPLPSYGSAFGQEVFPLKSRAVVIQSQSQIILVIEDDPALREQYRNALSRSRPGKSVELVHDVLKKLVAHDA